MKRLQLTLLFVSCAIAAPAPQNVFPAPYCQVKDEIDDQHKFQGDLIVGDYSVSGGKLQPPSLSPPQGEELTN